MSVLLITRDLASWRRWRSGPDVCGQIAEYAPTQQLFH
jgi:hypothetical protein